jgi:glycosyltransferase involved in cell wall biosynthesis
LTPHPNKRVWLLHQLRQYYEFFDHTREARDPAPFDQLRERIFAADTEALRAAAMLTAQSQTIARRLKHYNGIDTGVLYPPLPDTTAFYRGRFDPYIFVPSRLEHHKRQWLVIEAMRHVKSNIKAVIAGDGGAFHDYRKRIEQYGLGDRVLLSPFLSQGVMATYYANCAAVFFGPEEEDYGFVTIEAMASAKPVITCTDSGGSLEFVRHEVNGFVTTPDPIEIAETIDRIAGNMDYAKELGATGRDHYEVLDLSWEKTAETLLKGL